VDAIQALAGQVAASPALRVRQGEVVAVSSYGLTLKIAGSTSQITGVKYLGSYAPRVGAQVWLISDGSDIFAIGHLAPRGVPALQVGRSAVQSIPNSTETAITFTTEVGTDPWVLWAASPNPTRITAPLDGWYTFTGWVSFAANTTGIRGVKVRSQGTTAQAMQRVSTSSAGTTDLTVMTGPVSLAASNYVELTVEQTSGGNLDVTPVFRVQYVGPAE
jgi:hypothetical protein